MEQEFKFASACTHKVIRTIKIKQDGKDYIIDIVTQNNRKGKMVTIFWVYCKQFIYKIVVHVEEGEVNEEQLEKLIQSEAKSWIKDYINLSNYIPDWRKNNNLF